MNPHAEALLDRIQRELADLSAQTLAKEQALEAIRRQGEERWQAWQAQWQHWRGRIDTRQESRAIQARAVEQVAQADSDLSRIEEALRQCVEVGEAVTAA